MPRTVVYRAGGFTNCGIGYTKFSQEELAERRDRAMMENEAIARFKSCQENVGKCEKCRFYSCCGIYDMEDTAIEALEEIQKYRAIGTPEECRAAVEKQIVEKELESHDEKHILKYCISLMQELVGKFKGWYEYVHGEDAIRELDEVERFYYRMSYFSIVQELFLFRTSHSGGTSTRAKCKQLGVDWSDGIEFSFGGDEE